MTQRVLVADDSPTIRKIVQLCLAEAEIEFTGVAAGAEAVKSLKKTVPDLLLADVSMPAPDGYALCERVKRGEFGRPIPVVLLADPFAPFDTVRALQVGADGHVTKPFDARTLLAMVGDQLGGDSRDRALAATQPPPGEEPIVFDASPAFAAPRGDGDVRMTPAEIEAVARSVVGMISDSVVRDVAWEVVPELSELLIRERMQQQR